MGESRGHGLRIRRHLVIIETRRNYLSQRVVILQNYLAQQPVEVGIKS